MDSGAVSNKTKRFLAILCHHLEVCNYIIGHTAHKDLLAFKEAGMARLEGHVEIEKGLEEKVQERKLRTLFIKATHLKATPPNLRTSTLVTPSLAIPPAAQHSLTL